MATGALAASSITAVLESAYATLDQQCMSARRKRPQAAVVEYAFVVRDGRATNRRIDRSSSTDGTDECILRGFADLAFPSSPDETQVTLTVSYDPNVR